MPSFATGASAWARVPHGSANVWLTLRHRDGAAGPGEDGLDVAGSVVGLVAGVDGGVDADRPLPVRRLAAGMGL
jgi:hypothetical protein